MSDIVRDRPAASPAPMASARALDAPILRYVLFGDGMSPHLLKWARALAPRVELWLASSTGISDELAACVPAQRQLALGSQPNAAGGNVGLLWQLPRLMRWLRRVDADWINAHYLSSHGTLAWLALRGARLHGRLLASAWGSDVLVTPQRYVAYRWALRRVVRAAALVTSDSQHMAQRLREYGAAEVMVFPFGLDALPPLSVPPTPKQPWLVFANRGLEPIYRPERVLALFAALARLQPQAQLVVANEGSLRAAMQASAQAQGLTDRVRWVGRLGAAEQAQWYAQAQWYLSLPGSDSVSVSVLEAMAHGCIPVLSDLPANRELVRSGDNGLIVSEDVVRDDARPSNPVSPCAAWASNDSALWPALQALAARAPAIAQANRRWVAEHALFEPSIEGLLQRLLQCPRADVGAGRGRAAA